MPHHMPVLTNQSTKPNCYVCTHRGTVPGSPLSSCQHPVTAEVHTTPLAQMIREFGADLDIAFIRSPAARELGIVGAQKGLEDGLFIWPVSFDPDWLEACLGFSPIGGR